MIPITKNSDFSFYIPGEFSNKDFGQNSTLSISLFTINRDSTYDLTISANPCPIKVVIDGNNLRYMESGVLQAILTLNIPDNDLTDGYLNRTKIITTDLYYKKTSDIVDSSYYSKHEIRQILDDLEATIANEYIDSVELSDYVGQETYSKEYIDSLIAEINSKIDNISVPKTI